MASSTLDRLKLTVRQLDDRILPSISPALTIPPIWWTESKFIPTAASPGDDGGLWVVGTTQAAGQFGWWGPFSNDWGLVKLKADNTIDPSFNGGKVKDFNADLLDWFRVVQIQTGSEGKVYVLARNMARDPVIAQGMPLPQPVTISDFALPPTRTTTPLTSAPSAPSVGSITNADLTTSIWPYPLPNPIDAPEEDYAIVRFNADGSLDRTFNNDGIALFNLQSSDRFLWNSGGYDVIFDVNANGQIAVTAQQSIFYPSSFVTTFDVARLTPNGTFDSSFSGDGKAQITLPTHANSGSTYGQALGIQLAENGTIALGGSYSSWVTIQPTGGTAQTSNDTGFFVAKLTNAGSMDTTFNDDGIEIVSQTSFGNTQGIYTSDFTVAADGSYLFAGTKAPEPFDWPQPIPANFIYPQNHAFVAKLTPGGELDTGFDSDGILYPDYDNDLTATSAIRIVAMADGDFVLASHEQVDGSTPFASQINYAIARHNADGSIDPGMAIVRETPANSSWVSDLDVLTDGRLVAIAGYPQQLIVIDADGVPATRVTVPYDRIAPWSPPVDWTPFPQQPNQNHRETLADVNGDGVEDRIYVSGQGNRSSIRVVNGANGEDLINDYQPYEDRFIGGMFVDAGDFNGDGRAEIVVSPDVGGSARVQVFTYDVTGLRQRANFFAIEDPNFRGGGSIGVLDINEDGTPDVVVGAARGGSQRIANFDGKGIFDRNRPQPTKLFGDYFAPLAGLNPNDYRDGVELFTTDIDGDGTLELSIRPTGVTGASTVLFADATTLQFNVPGALALSLFDPLAGVFVG